MEKHANQFLKKLPLEIWVMVAEILKTEFKLKMLKLRKLDLIKMVPCPYFFNHWVGYSKRKMRNFLMIDSPAVQFEVAYSKKQVTMSQTFVLKNNLYGYYVTTDIQMKKRKADYIDIVSLAL